MPEGPQPREGACRGATSSSFFYSRGDAQARFSISILTFVLAVAGAQPKQPQDPPRRRQMRQGSPRSAAFEVRLGIGARGHAERARADCQPAADVMRSVARAR